MQTLTIAQILPEGREASTQPPITAEAVIAQALDAVVGLAKLTAHIAAERDRYHDALVAVALCGEAGVARIAREALASRRAS